MAILHESQTVDSKQLVSDADYNSAISGALLEYSRFYPQRAVQTYRFSFREWSEADVVYYTNEIVAHSGIYYQCVFGYTTVVGASTPDQDLTHWRELVNPTFQFLLPADWISGFSQMTSVEYPASEQDPIFVDPAGILVDLTYWRFRSQTVSAGDLANFSYTISHTEQTVPAPHLEAVAKLGAANVALEMASKTNVTTNPRVPADVTDYRSKADVWRSIAKDLRSAAGVILGINLAAADGSNTAGVAPAGQTVEWAFARP